MRVSLVISTHNRKDLLRRCLAAATSQDYPDYEVIVVDDGSTDGTEEMVRREFPQVRYLRQEPNRGPAAARNRGIEAATGEIVAFTDDDCLVPPDFLARLAEGYRHYPEVAGVGGYLEAPPEVLAHNLLARYERWVSRHDYGVGPREYVGGMECPAGGTNSVSYRRRVLKEVGGFDEGFPFAAGEDADLKYRVAQRGYRLLFIPVKVTHLQPYEWHRFIRQQKMRGRGAAYFEQKHQGHPPTRLRIILRWMKRTLLFGPNLVRMGDPCLALVRLIADWADVWGQWQMARRWR